MNVQPQSDTQPIPQPSPSPAERSSRVLLVEDDEISAQFLKERLELDGYITEVVRDGEGAEARLGSFDFNLVILDLTLPRGDGLDVLARLRAQGAWHPILVVTGRTKLEDRVRALDLGADDYLVKPFEYAELAARARALMRRLRPTEEIVIRYDDLELNRVNRRVKRAGRPIELTQKEYALLEYLLVNAGRCLTRSAISENVWRVAYNSLTNIVDVYINYLRNKIDRGSAKKLIYTVRGEGYQLGETVQEPQRNRPRVA